MSLPGDDSGSQRCAFSFCQCDAYNQLVNRQSIIPCNGSYCTIQNKNFGIQPHIYFFYILHSISLIAESKPKHTNPTTTSFIQIPSISHIERASKDILLVPKVGNPHNGTLLIRSLDVWHIHVATHGKWLKAAPQISFSGNYRLKKMPYIKSGLFSRYYWKKDHKK